MDVLNTILIITVLSLAIGLVLAYRRGVIDGKAIADNKPLQPIIQPPKAHKAEKLDEAQEQMLADLKKQLDYIDSQGKNL